MKIILIVGLLAIIAALAAAGMAMLRRPPADASTHEAKTSPSKRLAQALALRVALSVGLFLLILLAYLMGWIHPTGIPLKSS
jgi:archaellum biogenesis protein FlaJ (TadC family)